MSSTNDVRRTVTIAMGLLLSALLVLGFAPINADASTEERYGRRREMLALTNQDRSARERNELAFAARVSRYAKEHSRAMAEEGSLFHSSEDQLRGALAGFDWTLGGENVGVGGSLDSLEAAFMASKLHRENILRPQFDHAAIGVVRADGRIWVTVIFYG